jgi:hypothetical protein
MTERLGDEDLQDAELVATARQLGSRAADQLDLSRTARSIVARWRTEQARRRPFWRTPELMRIAAAAVLLIGGIATWRSVRTHAVEPVTAVEPTDAGLEGLSADQLQALLPAVEQPGPALETTANDAGLEGLTTDELRSVLTSMGS